MPKPVLVPILASVLFEKKKIGSVKENDVCISQSGDRLDKKPMYEYAKHDSSTSERCIL